MAALSFRGEDLARLPGQTMRDAIRGRAIFDLLAAYRKMHQAQKESYRLDAIAEDELGVTKIRYSGTVTSLRALRPCTGRRLQLPGRRTLCRDR